MTPRIASLSIAALATACYVEPSPPMLDTSADTSGSTSGGEAPTTSIGTTETMSTSDADTTTESADDTTVDETTTTEPAADDTSSSDGSPAPFCGDGILDDGEDCDDGDANDFEAECRPDCVFNACGDGYTWAGVEACDDGEDDNVVELGACAPDCSRVIEARMIVFGDGLDDGNFGNNPVAFADATCAPGYRALFAYPDVREATTVAFDSVGALDWVLQPYTAYTRMDGTLLWITDEIPLLGVRNGAQQPLLAGVLPECEGACLAIRRVSGLDDDWTTATADTCSLWSSTSPMLQAALGNPYSADDFLHSGQTVDCDDLFLTGVYCVEQ